MDTEYYFKGIARLKDIEEDRLAAADAIIDSLSDYEGCTLKVCNRGRAFERYIVRYENRKCIQKYITDDKVYFSLINLRFFKTLRKVIVSNLKALDSALAAYKEYSPEYIFSLIPATYCVITPEIDDFFHITAAREWMTKLLELKEEHPAPYHNSLQFTTSDGTLVRSKSELIIYEILLRHHFIFVYDAPYICADGTILHPDFTILKPDGSGVLLIEHDGAFDVSRKRTVTTNKMGEYYDSNLNFFEEILFTFDRSNHSINAKLIEDIILDCLYN